MMYKRLLSLAFLAATTNAFAAVTVVEPTNQATMVDIDGDNQFDFIETFESDIYIRERSDGYSAKSIVNFDLSPFTNSVVEFATIDFAIRDYNNDDIRVDLVAFDGEASISLSHGSAPAELIGSYIPWQLDELNTDKVALTIDASVLEPFLGNNLSLRFEISQGVGTSEVLPITSDTPPRLNLVLEDRLPEQPEIPAPVPSIVLEESFDTYGPSDNPDMWFDSRWGNSLTEQDNYQTALTDGNVVFSTSSTYTNIHSHYNGAELHSIQGGYEFEGKLKFDDSQAGIGVTFFSQYPNADHYYRLRRYGGKPYFHLSSHGTSVQGDTASDVAPGVNEWYEFKIRVEDTGTQTNIKVRLWEDGSDEPNEWQIDAFDNTSNRLTSGTIGVWSMRAGKKFWDEFVVTQLTPPAPLVETPDLLWLDLEQAFSLANTYNLLIGQVNYEIFLPGGPDQILEQNPSPGTLIEEGSEITLTVSSHTLGVATVPNLIGLQHGDAESFLGSTQVPVNPAQFVYGSFIPAGVVMSQYPYEGTDWSGERVSLRVSLGPRPLYFYENRFSGTHGGETSNWYDSQSGNRLSEDSSLFKLYSLYNDTALGTVSTETNIHSHSPQFRELSDYEFTGRMQGSDANSGYGVTFMSQYPNADKYYRLRRWERGGSFHLSPHGTSVSGTTNSGLTPVPNQWYKFRIRATDTGSETQIKARIWQEGEEEPSIWQIDAFDDSSSRLTSGAIGVWSMGPGNKYWDDFAIDL